MRVKPIDTIDYYSLKLLRELAENGTQGDWRNGADPSHFDAPEVTDGKTFAYYVTTDADAAYIAAASPKTMRLLLDYIAQLQNEVGALMEDKGELLYDNAVLQEAGRTDIATAIAQRNHFRDGYDRPLAAASMCPACTFKHAEQVHCRLHDEAHSLRREHTEQRQLLASVVVAWESLTGGRRHPPAAIEKWLVDDMGPAIDNIRKVIR